MSRLLEHSFGMRGAVGALSSAEAFLLCKGMLSCQNKNILTTLSIKLKIFGFQDREAWTILENEERSVRYWYVSTYNVFVENIHRKRNLSVAFKIRYRIRYNVLHRHQKVNFNNLFNQFKMLGFQYREDGELLENEERSVRYWYVSTAVFGSASYSMSNPLQRKSS